MSIAFTEGTGSIIVTYSTNKLVPVAVRIDSYAKGMVNIIADTLRNIIVFNNVGENGNQKGHRSVAFNYSDITAPSSTDVLDLKSQLDAWNIPSGGVPAEFVFNEAAKPAEMTGLNSVFTTSYPFVANSIEVFYNQLKMTLSVDYTEDGAAGEVTFLTLTPDDTLPEPDTLTFNYVKL